jgi:hypothetical protein
MRVDRERPLKCRDATARGFVVGKVNSKNVEFIGRGPLGDLFFYDRITGAGGNDLGLYGKGSRQDCR